MNKINSIIILVLSMLLFCNNAAAVKAGTKIVKYRQPNGSVVYLKVYGDEFYGYTKNISGELVNIGPDRYLHRVSAQQDKKITRHTMYENGREHLLRGAQCILPDSDVAYNSSKIRTRSNMVEQHRMESLVLLVEFADVKFTMNEPKEYFNSMLNGTAFYGNGATGSAAEYLNDNFGAGYDFSFNVEGIVTLPEKMESYGAKNEFFNDVNPAKMVREACEIASSMGVDFSIYDSDNDGVADNVAIIFAGYNEAESGDGSAIWPHYGNISNEDVLLSGVKIGGYSCSSEYTGDNTELKPATIGTFLHEFCHYLGLPDMYDVNGEVEGLSNALYGSLSIMDAGNYLNGGNTPPCLTSIEREILGLDEIEDLVPGNNYTLQQLPSASRIYRAESDNDGEYFFFECRNATGWDTHIGGSGMVVYHIDKSQNIIAGIRSDLRWKHNVINSYAGHECAKVLSVNSDLFFQGSDGKNSLSYNTFPNLRDWNGGGVGVSLENIAFANGTVTFRTAADIALRDTLPYAGDIRVRPYQKGAFIEWTPLYYCNDNGRSSKNGAGEWVVTVTDVESKSELFSSNVISSYVAAENLMPDKEYIVKVHYLHNRFMGMGNSIQFRTLPVSSQFPFVVFKQIYLVGDVLHIDVQNTENLVRGWAVKIDGKSMLDEYYTFSAPGEYHVEVLLYLSDASVEVINKLVKVDEK
ncbi:MAG: M6 family metalloprotease domain-containing protein [Bacteroidales bacterium]|nr:M6 family metalloprotease domain-containing protein [Bacteroidales bacterium]